VSRHLEVGERIVRTEALHGGITAEMRRLTIGTRDGGTRDLVLRTFVNVEHAEDWLNREAGALTLLAGTGVPAPGLVAVDPTAVHCEYPSLLMTHLAGRTVLDDEGLETRVPLLARQLVAIHALRPAERPREYESLLHGPAWGLRFAEAYEEAGGVLAAAASERLYWRMRDGLAFSEEVQLVAQPWQGAGRTELTTRAVEERLDAYVTALMDALG
jgi:hypothetical protein